MKDSLEIQSRLLATMITTAECIPSVVEVIGQRKVFRPELQTIYNTLVEIWEKEKYIDYLTLLPRLPERSQGPLADIIYKAGSPAGVVQWAKLLVRENVRSSVAAIGREIAHRATDESVDAFDILELAESKIFKLGAGLARKNFVSASSAMTETLERIYTCAEGGTVGIMSGLSSLDAFTGGFQPQDLIIVAARPSVGKTALALTTARLIAERGVPVGFFSLEMGLTQISTRLISQRAGIDSAKILRGEVITEQLEGIEKAAGFLSKLPLFIDDTGSLNVYELRGKARRMKAEFNVGIIFVDYLQLVTVSHKDTREQEVSTIAKILKGMAKELQLPVVCMSQLNRAVEARADKKPILADLRESGAIEQDADVVVFIHTADIASHDRTLIIAKQRNGPLADIPIEFVPHLTEFRCHGA